METRPWGWYEVLHDGEYKVKRIHVKCLSRLSLQSHAYRDERWIILKGTGWAWRGEEHLRLEPGVAVFIQRGQRHRIVNDSETDELELVEIQTGSYFGEDDIVRYEDDFGRSDRPKE